MILRLERFIPKEQKQTTIEFIKMLEDLEKLKIESIKDTSDVTDIKLNSTSIAVESILKALNDNCILHYIQD